jgi:hypothetical protein
MQIEPGEFLAQMADMDLDGFHPRLVGALGRTAR